MLWIKHHITIIYIITPMKIITVVSIDMCKVSNIESLFLETSISSLSKIKINWNLLLKKTRREEVKKGLSFTPCFLYILFLCIIIQSDKTCWTEITATEICDPNFHRIILSTWLCFVTWTTLYDLSKLLHNLAKVNIPNITLLRNITKESVFEIDLFRMTKWSFVSRFHFIPSLYFALHKTPKFCLISWCGN